MSPNENPSENLAPRSVGGWWILGLALGSVLFSMGMFAWQIANDVDQITGKIVVVATSSLSIVDVRGQSTLIVIDPSTEIRGRTTTLSPGQFIHVYGQKQPSGAFESQSIQIIERRPRSLPEKDTKTLH